MWNGYDNADEIEVSTETLEKYLAGEITIDDVKQGFDNKDIKVLTDNQKLLTLLTDKDYNNTVLLIMTSGNFSGIHIQNLANQLLSK